MSGQVMVWYSIVDGGGRRRKSPYRVMVLMRNILP